VRGVSSKQGHKSATWEVVAVNLLLAANHIIGAGQHNSFGMLTCPLKKMVDYIGERQSPMEIGLLKQPDGHLAEG